MNNSYINLKAQIDSIMKHCNEKSYKTRYRYYEATTQFIKFAGEHYHLQKFANTSSKHIIAYTEYMKAQGLSPATIKCNLAGVRFFYRHSNGKNVLIDNSKLDLQQREFGKINRAWLPAEIEKGIAVARAMGRLDIEQALKFGAYWGCRCSEICTLRVSDILLCAEQKELKITGKGGKTRYVQMTTPAQEKTIKEAIEYAKEHNLSRTDRLIVDSTKGGVQRGRRSIQNWINNNYHKFIIADRQAYITGDKVRTEKLTCHGLRASFAQSLYGELKEAKPSITDKEAREKVSHSLGHNRISVTTCYL